MVVTKFLQHHFFDYIIHIKSIFIVRKTIFKLPPWEYIGEAEQYPRGKSPRGTLVVETDGETATPTVETEGNHVVVFLLFLHDTIRI